MTDYTSFSFTTPEAWAQAGGGGGQHTGRAVTISVTTSTPGFSVSGPYEEGFEEGVTAFILEFTPPNPGDEPPAKANVSISTFARSGWTLKEPLLANLPIEREVPRGDFAEALAWETVRIVGGAPEDEAQGEVLIVWPWAKFEVELAHAIPGNAEVQRAGQFFRVSGTMELVADITITILPAQLPQIHKAAEAEMWRADWVQNMRSLGRTCYYPTKNVVAWWNTVEKANLPIYDSVAIVGEATIA